MAIVTIGISFYRDVNYLEYAILSVLNQSYTNWELFLVNDGSDDGSLEIARKFVSNKIFLLEDGLNLGLSKRLNQITALSKSKYICRMDADDIMHPNRLETQISFLEVNSFVDLVGSATYSIDNFNNIMGKRGGLTNKVAYQKLFFNNFFIHPTVMGKRTWFAKNPYESYRSQDYEIWLRTFENSNFYNLSQPLLFYREVGVDLIRKTLVSNKEVRRIVKKYFKTHLFISIRVYLFSFLKDYIYILLSALIMNKFLVNRRNVELSEFEMKKALSELQKAVRIGE